MLKSTWQTSEDQSKIWLRWTGCDAMVKGKLMGLAPMDLGEGEGQASELGSEGPKQR